MNARRRIAVFTDRYPLLGPFVWILCVQYFFIQLIAAAAWVRPYSWRLNVISDLGNSACGIYSGRYVCSPAHGLMNASLLVLGTTMAVGALLIYNEFKKNSASFAGFLLMGLGGIGTVLVGAFPENTVPVMHAFGAFLALLIGNVSMVVLALALQRVRTGFRFYTFFSGMFSILAFILFVSHIYLGLGQGGMERLASYPQTAWLVLFGLYMSATRVRARLSVSKS
jgi:hypothetical membrane protein